MPTRDNDFKPRSLGFWTWARWIGISFSLSTYIIYSTAELWPRLLWMAVLGAIAILVCSWYVAGHTREIEPRVRQKAWIAEWIMYGAMIINVALHGAASRDVATVAELRAEQIEAQNRAEAARDAAAKRMTDVLAAKTRAEAETRRRMEAEASLARQRGEVPRAIRGGDKAIDTTALATGINAPTDLASSAATAAAWFWFIFVGFLLEMVAGIAGSAMVQHERVKDDNANGIPDWIERLYRMNPAIVEARFPDFYRILSGQQAREGKEEFPRELDSAPKN